MCWYLRLRFSRRRKVAEEMSQSLKNSMVESFNRISSSMSGLMAGSINSKARQSSYTVGRGSGAPASRGPGMGRGAGRRRSRGGGLGPRGRGGNPPGRVDTTKGNKTHQNPKASSANKARHKKQRKRKDKGTLPEETNTLPTLCRFFKKPERQKGVNKPSQRFRRSFMTRSWERGVCDLSVLHDIAEEDEDMD